MKKVKYEPNKETNKIIRSMYITFGFFIVNLFVGIYILKFPEDIGIGIIALSLLIWNIFMTLYKLNITVAKRLLKK